MSIHMLYPSPINIFDKNVLIQYAQRIVRREMFLSYCSEDHQCVRDEMRLIIQSEIAIADLIRSNCGPDLPSSNLMDAFSSYMRRLIDQTVDYVECDPYMREDVGSRASSYNVLTPFTMAKVSLMH